MILDSGFKSQSRNKSSVDYRPSKEFLPAHPGSSPTSSQRDSTTGIKNNQNSVKNNTPVTVETATPPRPIESDMESDEVMVKRIWTKNMSKADMQLFNGNSRSIANLKDAFGWVNQSIMKVGDKKNAFRDLLKNDIFFEIPAFRRNPKMRKYRQHIFTNGAPNQDVVITYQAFVRNLLKTIAKPETFVLLSRNFGNLPFTERDREQMGELIDALISESDPNYDGNCFQISGRRIEELVRTHFNRILLNSDGVTRIEVNFRQSKIEFDFQLKTFLKFNQYAWSNVTGIQINKDDEFSTEIMDEFKEAKLLIRNLLTTDLIKPGKISSLFASDMAESWEMDENGVINNTEVWNPSRLTRLAKPAPLDDMLKLLKNEIRNLDGKDKNQLIQMAQCCRDPAKLVKWFGQSLMDVESQVASTDEFYESAECAIMFRMPERNDPNYNSILLHKWKHISEGNERGGDTGCQSCRRRSCTLTIDGIHEDFYLAQVFLTITVETNTEF